MPTVTIKHVAQHCGVSTATVSAVVNDAEWVSAETRARVRGAIDVLRYRPNHVARSLKTKKSDAVGVIVSDLTNPFFTHLVRSLSHALREHDRHLFLCDSDHQFDLGHRNFEMVLDRQVDGLVLIGDSVSEEVLRAYLKRRHRVPVIAIERDYAVEGVSCLLVNSEQGAFEVTRHLVEQDYRRIAMISGPNAGPGSATYGRLQRVKGYRRALREAGLALDRALTVEGNFRYAGGEDAMRRLLASRRPPEAVFAANDMMALGAMTAAREAGLRVPDDVALAGYDDVPFAALTAPGLTTMAMPKEELGQCAAALLEEQIRHRGRHEAVRRTFSAALVVRGSSRRTRAIAREPVVRSTGVTRLAGQMHA